MQASLLTRICAPGGQSGWASRLDTRVKLVMLACASLMTIYITSPEAQYVLFGASAVYALGMRRVRLLVACYLFVVMLLMLAFGFTQLIHVIFPKMPSYPISTLFVPFLRLLVMINVVLPLAFCTRVQSVLSTLKSIRLPFCLYIPMAVMVRFIPTFASDMKQIAEALKIRGYNLSLKQFFRHPVTTTRVVFIPMIFRSLKTSEELGIAAELKGLSAARTLRPYRVSSWTRRDTLLILAVIGVCMLAVYFNSLFPARSFGGMHR